MWRWARALLLKSRSECRKDSLELSLERLSWTMQSQLPVTTWINWMAYGCALTTGQESECSTHYQEDFRLGSS